MQAYTGFAAVYDTFMDNIPYEEWCEYLTGLLKEQGVTEGVLLDLGCGTGSLTELLADAGYDMIGVDNSEEMLELALEKKEQSGKDILYLCQDMREFELYGTVAAVVSICDCMNYILEPEDLTEVFRLVNNYLDPGGVFIFDMNTEYNTGRSWETTRSRKTGMTPALSGTTSTMRRSRSISMICRSLSVRMGISSESTMRPIISGLIPWKR